MEFQVFLQLTMQQEIVIAILDPVKLICKFFKSKKIVFAALPLDAVEIGIALRIADSLLDLAYLGEKVSDFRDDFPVEISFSLLMA